MAQQHAVDGRHQRPEVRILPISVHRRRFGLRQFFFEGLGRFSFLAQQLQQDFRRERVEQRVGIGLFARLCPELMRLPVGIAHGRESVLFLSPSPCQNGFSFGDTAEQTPSFHARTDSSDERGEPLLRLRDDYSRFLRVGYFYGLPDHQVAKLFGGFDRNLANLGVHCHFIMLNGIVQHAELTKRPACGSLDVPSCEPIA